MARHHVKAKFVAVGIWNTVVGYLVFVALDTAFSHVFTARYNAYMAAMIVANVAAVVNAYIFHKWLTFNSGASGKGMITEFFKFCATYVLIFLLNLGLLPFLVEILKIPPKLAGALLIPICTVISYLGHSRFSFKQKL